MKRAFAVLFFLSCFGCKNEEDYSWMKEPPPNRYEVLQIGSLRRDQYLLDKATGQLWVKTCYVTISKNVADCEYDAWIKVDIEDINKSLAEIHAIARSIEKNE